MSRLAEFIFRRRGRNGWHWTDIFTWVWLIGGLFIMFGPAVWLVGSSFKSPAALAEFPPSITTDSGSTRAVRSRAMSTMRFPARRCSRPARVPAPA